MIRIEGEGRKARSVEYTDVGEHMCSSRATLLCMHWWTLHRKVFQFLVLYV
jgi:hypothetical protein